MKRLIPALVAAVATTLLAGSLALAAPGAEFKLGFKLLADRIPSVVGQPLENERHNPLDGDGLQQTTTGLMVWRKADNFTAFTNGWRTWVNGPFGIQERGSDQRFDWEGGGQRFAATTVSSPAVIFDVVAEQVALELINQSRQENGLPPVAMDEALRRVARGHAQDMSTRNFFDHKNPDGQSPFDRMRVAGIAYRWAAENLGWGRGFAIPSESVRSNHRAMMAETPPEDGHRRVILNGNLRKVGIGVYEGADGKVHYVADFTN